MSDIFLSYASEDRERVRPLAEALMAEGWSVFWDRNIPVGKTWGQMLEEEFASACSLVVVWSKHAVKSDWVREEANEARRRQLPIFPILLEGVLPPLGFRSIQAADFSNWDDTPTSPLFQSLIRDIKVVLCLPATPKSELEPVKPKPVEIEVVEKIFQEPITIAQPLTADELLELAAPEKMKEHPLPEPRPPEVKKGRLWVETEPAEALVELRNFAGQFSQGMELEPGRYELEATAEGFEPHNDWVELGTGEERHLKLQLTPRPAPVIEEKAAPAISEAEPVEAEKEPVGPAPVEPRPPEVKKSRLWVETEPPGANVTLPDVKGQFAQGMELEPGWYAVEVMAEGFEWQRKWVELGAGEERPLKVQLTPRPAPVMGGETTTAISEAPLEPEPPLRRKSRQPIIGAGLGLAVVLMFGWWLLSNWTKPIPPPPAEMKPFTNSIGMTFVLIPAGSFQMGSPVGEEDRNQDEQQHKVTISKPFYLQTTEVTQGQWQKVMENNPSSNRCKDCPVENVSWDDAQKFIRKLNRMENTDKYRLPIEAEWEYACRAGSNSRFCFGDAEAGLKKYAWYTKNAGDKTHPVGQLKPNSWGLYDMHGNVWEWCQDWFGPYAAKQVTDPRGPDSGTLRVLRGGSWYSWDLRSARRDLGRPGYSDGFIGFRVARTF
jgi:formylglycine-generating enzyme required for sulfatase activity